MGSPLTEGADGLEVSGAGSLDVDAEATIDADGETLATFKNEPDSSTWVDAQGNTWAVDGSRQYGTEPVTFFNKNEMVQDQGWLLIANKDTSDTAAPVNVGSPSYDMPDAPAFVEQTHAGVVWTGHIYTTTQPGFIKRIEVWVPHLSGSTSYRILIGDYSDPC